MEELRKIYKESIPGKINALEDLLKAFLNNEPEAEDSIRRMAHSLKGSGGTYGFPQITELAGILETSSIEEISDNVSKLISELKNILDESGVIKNNILIIDDDPDICNVFKAKLSDYSSKIFIAETGQLAKDILGREKIDIIILDIMLPDMDGRNLLVELKNNPKQEHIPVVIISSKISHTVKQECFALGVDDFIEKPFDPDKLKMMLKARLQKNVQLSTSLVKDNLTGLFTRSSFYTYYSKTVNLAERQKKPISLTIIDIDDFKFVNDTYGHNAGDLVLKTLASILNESIREADYLVRWGGEEFVILFPNTNIAGAKTVMEKIFDKTRKLKIPVQEEKEISITISAGLIEINPKDMLSASIEKADKYLYEAKKQGKNRIIYNESDKTIYQKTIVLVEDDELISSLVKFKLGREGYKIIHYKDGIETMNNIFEYDDINLILLDIKIPGIDGFEILRHLRGNVKFKRIPIVMFTSLGQEKDIERGFALGADDYVLKPFSNTELIMRIRRLLK